MDWETAILDYLRGTRGTLVPTMKMVEDLSPRIKPYWVDQKRRGEVFNMLRRLLKEKKVVLCNRLRHCRNRTKREQRKEFLRISEKYY